MSKTEKRGRGRPPKHETTLMKPMTIRLTEDIDQRLEARRAARLDHPDKSVIVREILAEALK